MKASTLFLIPLFLFAACGTARVVPTQDSTRVEVRTEIKTVRDTAWLELPVYIEKVATLDTLSVLENKYARSEAIVSAGILKHSLETKPVKEAVIYETKETVRDSIIWRDRLQTQTVEVEKKLNTWQEVKLRVGGFCFFLLILIGLYLILSYYIHFKSIKP